MIKKIENSNAFNDYLQKIKFWKNLTSKHQPYSGSITEFQDKPVYDKVELAYNLKLIFSDIIKYVLDYLDDSYIPYIFHIFISEIIEDRNITQIFSFEEHHLIFVDATRYVISKDPISYSSIDSLPEVSAETFELVIEKIIRGYISQDWINSEYWNSSYLKKIKKVDDTSDTRFAARKLLIFLETMKEKAKRYQKLKSH